MHSDDSISGCFRPSHIILLRAGSHRHSMGGKGHQVHELVGLYSVPQCNAGTITAVVTIFFYYVLFRLNLPLNKFRRQCYDGGDNMSGQRTGVAKRMQEIEPGQSNHILKATRCM